MAFDWRLRFLEVPSLNVRASNLGHYSVATTRRTYSVAQRSSRLAVWGRSYRCIACALLRTTGTWSGP